MDRISYECAKKVNDVLVCLVWRVCGNKLKVWRYPVSSNGGHASTPYVDDMNYDDNPDDKYDDTIIAPDWEDLRKSLNSLNPSWYILSEFEAIENIDEYAYKLVDYYRHCLSCK